MRISVKYVNDCVEMIRCVYSTLDLTRVVFPLLMVFAGLTRCANGGPSNPIAGSPSNRLRLRRTESSERQFDSTVCGWIDWRRVRSDTTVQRDRDHGDGTGTMNSNANAGNANNTLPAGSFTFAGDYKCPSASSEVYLAASGGNPGLGSGTNANLALMTALGPCGNLSSSTFVSVNELTTIGTIAALSNFVTSTTNVGSGSSDSSLLQTAFSVVNEYTNTANGAVPGHALPAGYSASSIALQTLGDIVAACINSAGGVAGDGSACGQLFPWQQSPAARPRPIQWEPSSTFCTSRRSMSPRYSHCFLQMDPFSPHFPPRPRIGSCPLPSTRPPIRSPQRPPAWQRGLREPHTELS